MQTVSGLIVVAFGLCLTALAIVIVLRPPLAERFIKSFASSARAHYTEQVARLVAGTAIVIFSPSMWHPSLFKFFGWLIVLTAVVLLLVPWKWHHRFATWAIPLALRHLKLYAVGVLALGLTILYGSSRFIFAW